MGGLSLLYQHKNVIDVGTLTEFRFCDDSVVNMETGINLFLLKQSKRRDFSSGWDGSPSGVVGGLSRIWEIN